MKRMLVIFSITFLVATEQARSTFAVQVWTGPKITFSKAAFGNVSLSENQDRITSNVWLTRASSRGLYNIKVESSFTNNSSPLDTEWSFGTTADLDDPYALFFEDWQSAVGSNPPASIGEDMVVHLISHDIYIDIKFLTWGEGPSSGGFFSYERSTPIPEPTSIGLTLAGMGMALRRRRPFVGRPG